MYYEYKNSNQRILIVCRMVDLQAGTNKTMWHWAIILASTLWLCLYYISGHKVCHHKLIRFMVFINPLTLYSIWYNPYHVAICACLELLLGIFCHQIKAEKCFTKSLWMIGIRILFVLLVQPLFMPIVLIQYLHLPYNATITKSHIIKTFTCTVLSIVISTIPMLCIYSEKYFPQRYSKSSNLVWIVYSHMFKSYSILYQSLFNIIPFLMVYPIILCKVQKIMKICVQYFICIFFMSNISHIYLWLLYCLYLVMYAEVINHKNLASNKKKQIVWNVINIMVVVISVPSYMFYEHIIWIWNHTHLVSVGYFLLQILLFWGVHIAYLTEALIILEPQKEQQESNKKLIVKIKQYLVKKIKQM